MSRICSSLSVGISSRRRDGGVPPFLQNGRYDGEVGTEESVYLKRNTGGATGNSIIHSIQLLMCIIMLLVGHCCYFYELKILWKAKVNTHTAQIEFPRVY